MIRTKAYQTDFSVATVSCLCTLKGRVKKIGLFIKFSKACSTQYIGSSILSKVLYCGQIPSNRVLNLPKGRNPKDSRETHIDHRRC